MSVVNVPSTMLTCRATSAPKTSAAAHSVPSCVNSGTVSSVVSPGLDPQSGPSSRMGPPMMAPLMGGNAQVPNRRPNIFHDKFDEVIFESPLPRTISKIIGTIHDEKSQPVHNPVPAMAKKPTNGLARTAISQIHQGVAHYTNPHMAPVRRLGPPPGFGRPANDSTATSVGMSPNDTVSGSYGLQAATTTTGIRVYIGPFDNVYTYYGATAPNTSAVHSAQVATQVTNARLGESSATPSLESIRSPAVARNDEDKAAGSGLCGPKRIGIPQSQLNVTATDQSVTTQTTIERAIADEHFEENTAAFLRLSPDNCQDDALERSSSRSQQEHKSLERRSRRTTITPRPWWVAGTAHVSVAPARTRSDSLEPNGKRKCNAQKEQDDEVAVPNRRKRSTKGSSLGDNSSGKSEDTGNEAEEGSTFMSDMSQAENLDNMQEHDGPSAVLESERDQSDCFIPSQSYESDYDLPAQRIEYRESSYGSRAGLTSSSDPLASPGRGRTTDRNTCRERGLPSPPASRDAPALAHRAPSTPRKRRRLLLRKEGLDELIHPDSPRYQPGVGPALSSPGRGRTLIQGIKRPWTGHSPPGERPTPPPREPSVPSRRPKPRVLFRTEAIDEMVSSGHFLPSSDPNEVAPRTPSLPTIRPRPGSWKHFQGVEGFEELLSSYHAAPSGESSEVGKQIEREMKQASENEKKLIADAKLVDKSSTPRLPRPPDPRPFRWEYVNGKKNVKRKVFLEPSVNGAANASPLSAPSASPSQVDVTGPLAPTQSNVVGKWSLRNRQTVRKKNENGAKPNGRGYSSTSGNLKLDKPRKSETVRSKATRVTRSGAVRKV